MFIRNLFVPGLAALALAACGSDMSTLETAGASADQKPKLELNVARLQIATGYEAPEGATHVEDELAVPLHQRVLTWADARLAPRGREGVARITVTDASIVETRLTEDAGISAPMRAPQTIRFTATLAATFEAVDEGGKRTGYTQARAELSRTMSAHESAAARRQVLDMLADAVLEKFDQEMETSLRAYAGPYVM